MLSSFFSGSSLERIPQGSPAEKEDLALERILPPELKLVAGEEATHLGGGGDLGPHTEDVRSDVSKRVRDVRASVIRYLPLRVADHPGIELRHPWLPGRWLEGLPQTPLEDEVIAYANIYPLLRLVS